MTMTNYLRHVFHELLRVCFVVRCRTKSGNRVRQGRELLNSKLLSSILLGSKVLWGFLAAPQKSRGSSRYRSRTVATLSQVTRQYSFRASSSKWWSQSSTFVEESTLWNSSHLERYLSRQAGSLAPHQCESLRWLIEEMLHLTDCSKSWQAVESGTTTSSPFRTTIRRHTGTL